MRKLKFRTWDEPSSEHGQGGMCIFVNHLPRNDATAVMQYTGLKDKNGVEIYEGDIVKCVATTNDHCQKGSIDILVVRENMGNMCLCFKDRETGVTIYPFNVNHELEVIGNIHYNPELLE